MNYRNVCYKCKYANSDRLGDITIMDYWGIEKQYPNFMDSNGVSAMLVNTYKGSQILKQLEDKMYLIETTLENVSKENKNLVKPSDLNEIRKNAYKNIDNVDFNKYVKESLKFKKKTIDIAKSMVPKKIKQTLKKIIRR